MLCPGEAINSSSSMKALSFSPQQQQALESAEAWYNTKHSPFFKVFGFAGTGKTTIAREFAKPGTIFAAYTGKAAHVMRSKGCVGAQTLHSLIYLPSSKSAQQLKEMQAEYVELAKAKAAEILLRPLRDAIEREKERVKSPSFTINSESRLKEANLLIVDEVSMVDMRMAEDLLSFEVPILVLGDPAQLPPVKSQGYFTDGEPDVLLTEVHRQAQGSPVLHLATEVREGRGLKNAMDGMLFERKGKLSPAMLAKWDQILVGTHKSRKLINTRMREYYGFPDNMPSPGDRIICTRNDPETGLLNGSQWVVQTAILEEFGRVLLQIKSAEGEGQMTCEAHLAPFVGGEVPFYEIREAQCFEYAYAMTVHKAQGSQFDSVVLIDESRRFPAHQRRAWLYTGITRAANDLMVVI